MNEPADEPAGMFPPTRWTSIFIARDHQKTLGREALCRLLEKYRPPSLAHLKWRFRCAEEQAEDWFHGFVEKKILENELLKSADQKRGRFRTFLLCALDNFVKDELNRAKARKRNPEGGIISTHALEPGDQPVCNSPNSDPFDVAWARAVLDQAVERLREFYLGKGRKDLWGVFDLGFLQPTLNDSGRLTMADLAAQLGFDSAEQASNGLVSARRQFKRTLESVIAEYAEDEDSIEAEIRELMAILAGSD